MMMKVNTNRPDVEFYDLVKVLCQHCQNLKALCVPKDYTRPQGYPTPELFMLSAYTGADVCARGVSPAQDVTSYSVHVTSSTLIRYQVPTYFVSQDLCEALLETEAPEDMLFSELKWPMPAMMFMLPEAFSERYFGNPVPFITACTVEAYSVIRSALIRDGKSLPEIPVYNKEPFFCSTMLSIENGYPMHYDSRCPVSRPVKDLIFASEFELYRKTLPDELTAHSVEDDKRSVRRMTTLAVNLILAATSMPEMISRERILRPAKKDGKEVIRRALWKPNFIGEHFRIQYEHKDAEGTHRSPHAHWRRGHWRNQRYGEKLSQVKRIWIQPVFVGLQPSSPAGTP